MTEAEYRIQSIIELKEIKMEIVSASARQENYEVQMYTYQVLIFFSLLFLSFLQSHYLGERFWR